MNPFNIAEQNSHFKEEYYYDVLDRRIEQKVWSYIDDKRIIAILGIRRVGKSYLLKKIINKLIKEKSVKREDILYFSFDKFSRYKGDAIRDCINQYLAEYHGTNLNVLDKDKKLYILLDEVQKVPFFNSNIKSIYDFHENIKFIISGSSSYNIREDQNETLAGRIIDIEMFPLSWQEYLEVKEKKEQINTNFLYEIIEDNNVNKEHIYLERPKNYFLEFLLHKDIIEAIFIDDKTYIDNSIIPKIFDRELLISSFGKDDVEFYETAHILFTKNGNIINLTKIAETVHTSKYQVKDVINKGKALYFWDTLEGKQKDKLYTTSTSIAYHMHKESFFDIKGVLYENKIFYTLLKEYKNIYYYRYKDEEIDFIIKDCGVECKFTNDFNTKKYINTAKKLNLRKLIFIGTDRIKYEKIDAIDIWHLPWWMC